MHKRIKSICFVANKYPNNIDKNGLVFVQQLVWTMADLGIKCTVICPLASNLNPKFWRVPEHIVEKTENGVDVNVYFPKFFGLGQSHYILGKSPAPITTKFFTDSVINTIVKYNIQFDAVYGHFAAPAGVCAARVGRRFGKPSFMAHGESTAWSIEQYGVKNLKKEFDSLTGVIAVSSRNKDLLVDYNVVPEDKIAVFPNGYRPERFHPSSKENARSALGWNQEYFIAGFVGSFIERKGPLRVQEAVEKIDDVYFACAGKGSQIPGGTRCIFSGSINNCMLNDFYNALDVFVLPTQNEGCCNAIVEAIACGCPIISSDKKFNYDICDTTNSILVDPDSVEQIAAAINKLKSNKELQDHLRKGSLIKAKKLTLDSRANQILEYMENK